MIYTSTFADVMRGMDWSVLTNMILRAVPALICITLHEISHGYVAYWLGDNTAKRMGRLSLNPIKHIDILGLIMMIGVGFGWAKAVPINMRKFKNPKRGMALTALAGPVANIIISVVFLFILGLTYAPLLKSGTEFSVAIMRTIYVTAYLSTALAVFNLLPIPPLDGSKVLFSLMSDESYYKLMKYERYGMILLMVLLFSKVLGNPLNTATDFVFGILSNAADWGFALSKLIM